MRIPIPPKWRQRPVFVSSTFRDMHAERDFLHRHIFPRLAEKLLEQRVHLEPVDLRIGVETTTIGDETAQEIHVLRVCIQEIKRSRPFFIVLLGDRYGFVPPEALAKSTAREAGLEVEVAGQSVTALEIAIGLRRMASGEQAHCHIFLRKSLPYEQMPPEVAATFSDRFAPDEGGPQRAQALDELKTRLKADAALRPNLHEYAAHWDPATGRVGGLEEFGELVYDALWHELSEETRRVESQGESWDDEERRALDFFIEMRARDFAGREDLVRNLTMLACDPSTPGRVAAVRGGPGSGKSSLFARLARELEGKGILVLAYAGGATPLSREIPRLLGRWIGELMRETGVVPPAMELEVAFAAVLTQAATQRRVVLLLDGHLQESLVRHERLLAWLPRPLPDNVRLIFTMPDEGPQELPDLYLDPSQLQSHPVPPLSRREAAEILRLLAARHHREPNPEAIRALLSHTVTSGPSPGERPSFAQPLWLTLAAEQLEMLDEEDFGRADRTHAALAPGARMAALRAGAAETMPPDLSGLCRQYLARVELTHGAAAVRGFLVALALGRQGWRETDLLVLVPSLSRILAPDQAPPAFGPLQLAELRRAFRAFLHRQGQGGRLEIAHSILNEMIPPALELTAAQLQQVHGRIADCLEQTPLDDEMRVWELMHHLLSSGDEARGRSHLVACGEGEAYFRAIDSIGRFLDALDATPIRAWVASWFPASSSETASMALAADRLVDTLLPRIIPWLGAEKAGALLAAMDQAWTPLAGLCSSLSGCKSFRGRLALEQGAIDQAITHLADSINLRDSGADPIALASDRLLLGKAYLSKGRPEEASEPLAKALAALQDLAQENPDSPLIPDLLTEASRSSAQVAEQTGDLETAIAICRANVEQARNLVVEAASQHNFSTQDWALANSLHLLARLTAQAHGLAPAEEPFREAEEIYVRLLASAPGLRVLEGDVLIHRHAYLSALMQNGQTERAASLLNEALFMCHRLHKQEPDNVRWRALGARMIEWQRELDRLLDGDAESVGQLYEAGEGALENGDWPAAVEFYRQASRAYSRRSRGMMAEELLFYSNLHYKAGQVLQCLGQFAEARDEYLRSLPLAEGGAAIYRNEIDLALATIQCQQQLTNCYLRLGDLGAASATSEACHAHCLELAERDPSYPLLADWLTLSWFQRGWVQMHLAKADLAVAYLLQARDRLRERRSETALDFTLEPMLSQLEQLNLDDPDPAQLASRFQDWSILDPVLPGPAQPAIAGEEQNKLAERLSQEGKHAQAVVAAREAVALAQKEYELNPGSIIIVLSACRERLAAELRALGNLDESLVEFARVVELRLAMTRQEPGKARNWEWLAQSQVNLGQLHLERGVLPEALRRFELAREAANEMMTLDERAGSLILARVFGRLGSVLLQMKDLDRFIASLKPVEELASRYAQFEERDLKLEATLDLWAQQLMDLAEQKAYRKHIALLLSSAHYLRSTLLELATVDPNRLWKLGFTLLQQGNEHLRRGDRPSASATAKQALEIGERLQEVDPSSVNGAVMRASADKLAMQARLGRGIGALLALIPIGIGVLGAWLAIKGGWWWLPAGPMLAFAAFSVVANVFMIVRKLTK